MKVGKKDHYDINTIDSKTKYVVEEGFMKSRSRKKIDAYYKRIKLMIYPQVLKKYKKEKEQKKKQRKLFIFVSDGFQNYKHSAKKSFGRVCKIVFGVPIACKKYGLKHNNNAIEKYNQEIEDRYKTTRHWGNFQSAKHTLKMRQIIHNFVNPHMELKGKTPAEAAEINVDLGRNKLLKLIELAHMPKS